jgi:hypothetical protein
MSKLQFTPESSLDCVPLLALDKDACAQKRIHKNRLKNKLKTKNYDWNKQ